MNTMTKSERIQSEFVKNFDYHERQKHLDALLEEASWCVPVICPRCGQDIRRVEKKSGLCEDCAESSFVLSPELLEAQATIAGLKDTILDLQAKIQDYELLT